ncbi:FtsW/RodA/SpoVE family cell cycle protein [Massilia sp. G4R7]|uniref:Probable peptidoglycan glycosyltransferase FtsW n=1 Tax=Massilia phyllostachyos TaxID=2898585 RepID=A0ABS8Q4K5_9BURK|nr:FtsW/RodA/SpoVE family cell cycle protein [Massilia phyllostachyos]MCD2516468.1 FtsW/RodA/SpoVE family cell cycle protein [Massilia phyllostachyos]
MISRISARLLWAALALGLVCLLQLAALLATPQRYLPTQIDLRLAPGESAVLGRAELAAPRAGPRQFLLRRDAQGSWWLRNTHPAQPAVLLRGENRQATGTLALAPGQQLQLGATPFEVLGADDERVLLRGAGHRWEYDGALLTRDGAVQPPCPDAGAGSRIVGFWNRIAPHALSARRPLNAGGYLYCGNRLAAPGLEAGTVSMARGADGGIVLQVRGAQPVPVRDADGMRDVARREHLLSGIDTIAVGRTRLDLEIAGDTLRLRPAAQVELFAEPRAELPPALRWTWTERSLWTFPAPSSAAWAAALAAGLLAGLAGLRRGVHVQTGCGAAIVGVALLLLVMQRGGQAPGVGWALLLAWAALWYALLWPRRPPLLAVAATLLLGAGLLVQLELGLGARDTSWMRQVETSCVLLGAGLPAGLLLMRRVARAEVSRGATEWLLVALALVALLGLLLQVAFGNETGVFDIQPVEFAKLALAALSAHCLAVAAGSGGLMRGGWRAWLRALAPVLLFVLLLAVALVQVDDYSPLVLLLVWAAAILLAWCLASGRRHAAGLVGAACCAVLAGAMALQALGPSLGAAGFYTERFQVWADPGVHPHTGQQMLLGARAVGQGGWLGMDGMLGLASLGQQAGEALRIPAVQDDFAPSFLLHRHGLASAVLLWALQALLLGALLHAAVLSWRAGVEAKDFRRAWLGRFQCFALAGGAAFLGGHFLLSWGTNLALFPIMGQPMSFLSAGGSHLLFFICPLLAFGVASVQSAQRD